MECLWGLFRHRQPDGHCYQQDQTVLYVHFHPHYGITDHHLHDPGFLEKYAPLYLGGQKKSLVLSLTRILSIKKGLSPAQSLEYSVNFFFIAASLLAKDNLLQSLLFYLWIYPFRSHLWRPLPG